MKRKATRKRRSSPNTPAAKARIQMGSKAVPDAREWTSEELPHIGKGLVHKIRKQAKLK